ncbi:MAG: Fe-S cluster assembly protein IscX [Planctomycetota bacterium]
MSPKLTWSDSEDLGLALYEQHPDVDPLGVRFTQLRDWVCELEEFGDDPNACNEKKLEIIQMAWLEEYQDS